METSEVTYILEAKVDPKWLGLLRDKIKQPGFTLIVRDAIMDDYLPASTIDETELAAILAENAVLVSKGFAHRYYLHVQCAVTERAIMEQALSVFAYIGQPIRSITYTL